MVKWVWMESMDRISSGAARHVPFLARRPISMSVVSVTTYKAGSSGREVRKESRCMPQRLRAQLAQHSSPNEHVLPPGLALCDISPATTVKHKKSLLLSPGYPLFCQSPTWPREQLLGPAIPPPKWALAETEIWKQNQKLPGEGKHVREAEHKYDLLAASPTATIWIVLLVLARIYWSWFYQGAFSHLSSAFCRHKVGRCRMQVGIYILSNCIMCVHGSPPSSGSFH